MSKTALAGVALALMTVACQSLENSRSEIPVRELFAGNQCAVAGAELRVLENSSEAASLTNAHRIGSKPPLLNIDSDRERILLVAAGSKPSAGYRLQLTKGSAELHDGALNLPVLLTSPGQNRQAAMITSPCLLLAVQRGSYTRIVVDSLNLELELPEEPAFSE
jgi:hypothetical protein